MTPQRYRSVSIERWLAMAALTAMVAGIHGVRADAPPLTPPAAVVQAEASRIDVIRRVMPSAVCVYDEMQRGGGSGVLIDPDGYGVTNYHVVAGMLNTRTGWGGLGDGVLYELEVLGVDVTGDVAMFRLIGPKEGFKFPFARFGDSDRVRIGDTAIAVGNPFSLSEDQLPSVTLGMITGVHRYQWGVKGNLVYSDCIQIDAPINPGNSGGPLFNEGGEIIGINGRISVNTRGRFNVGFGYAISANQIKRFVPSLRAGLLARHGAWRATVKDDSGAVRFSEVEPAGPADNAGIRPGDTLLSLDGVSIRTANQVASLLGTYPGEWPVVAEVARDNKVRATRVELEPVDPNMRGPFLVHRETNLRAVRRVLEGFHRNMLPDGTPSTLRSWAWTVTRQFHPEENGGTRSGERYDAAWSAGGPVRLTQWFDDGSRGRIIEFDATSATQRTRSDAEAYDLPSTDATVLESVYVLMNWATTPVPSMDLTDVLHGGSGAIVTPMLAEADAPSPAGSTVARVRTQVLDVLLRPIGDGIMARFGFDAASFAPVEIRVLDARSNLQVTISLEDVRNVGGINWPTAMEVRAGGSGYRERWTNWEITP